MTAIVEREPAKLIGDIIQHELELDAGRVVLENEKVDIPLDKGIWVALSYVGGRAIGNNNYSVATDAGMNEVQEAAFVHQVQVDVLSYDGSARTRKEEIVMALQSVYAQELQDQYQMSVARVPGQFANTSMLEETKLLNRFTITVTVNSIYRKVKEVAYYTQFSEPEVHVNE